MAELTKIIRGMQNGAESINTNFNALNEEIKQTSDASVQLTGDQTIAGKKSFTSDASFKNAQFTGTVKQASDVPWTAAGGNARYKREGSLYTIDISMDALGGAGDFALATVPIQGLSGNLSFPVSTYNNRSARTVIVSAEGKITILAAQAGDTLKTQLHITV